MNAQPESLVEDLAAAILDAAEQAKNEQELILRALRLSCTGPEMVDDWNAMAERGWVEATPSPEIPGAAIDPGLRERLRMEIEALVAYDVLGLTRPEFEIVLDSFDHLAATGTREHGEFRTRRLALEAYRNCRHYRRRYLVRDDPRPAARRPARPASRAAIRCDGG